MRSYIADTPQAQPVPSEAPSFENKHALGTPMPRFIESISQYSAALPSDKAANYSIGSTWQQPKWFEP